MVAVVQQKNPRRPFHHFIPEVPGPPFSSSRKTSKLVARFRVIMFGRGLPFSPQARDRASKPPAWCISENYSSLMNFMFRIGFLSKASLEISAEIELASFDTR